MTECTTADSKVAGSLLFFCGLQLRFLCWNTPFAWLANPHILLMIAQCFKQAAVI